jgi:pimeloyl-ACP methyl ester carboxylesterase
MSGQGQPLVLIHGVGLDLSIWNEMAPLLEPSYRVIRYDMLGHGRSLKPPGPYRLDDFVRQLAELAGRLGLGRFDLAGFSMGGMVAQAFAAGFPQRLRRLALLNVVFDRSPAQRAAVLERLRLSEANGYAASIEAALAR